MHFCELGEILRCLFGEAEVRFPSGRNGRTMGSRRSARSADINVLGEERRGSFGEGCVAMSAMRRMIVMLTILGGATLLTGRRGLGIGPDYETPICVPLRFTCVPRASRSL